MLPRPVCEEGTVILGGPYYEVPFRMLPICEVLSLQKAAATYTPDVKKWMASTGMRERSNRGFSPSPGRRALRSNSICMSLPFGDSSVRIRSDHTYLNVIRRY